MVQDLDDGKGDDALAAHCLVTCEWWAIYSTVLLPLFLVCLKFKLNFQLRTVFKLLDTVRS
jgi:hypothetical protein